MGNGKIKPNVLQQSVQCVASTALGGRLLIPTLHRLDRIVLQGSRGRTTATSLFTGLPVITLTTIGAKSHQPRSVPLVAIPDGDEIVLIASNFGQKQHPAWYYNLCKNPHAVITRDRRQRNYTARETEGDEYDRYWQQAVQLYAGYAAYKARTEGRRIPILVLTPTGDR
jgi:deazaflavin-dependent oxidoreductase (nitroreductase family)